MIYYNMALAACLVDSLIHVFIDYTPMRYRANVEIRDITLHVTYTQVRVQSIALIPRFSWT